jgi:hypothetical protein
MYLNGSPVGLDLLTSYSSSCPGAEFMELYFQTRCIFFLVVKRPEYASLYELL